MKLKNVILSYKKSLSSRWNRRIVIWLMWWTISMMLANKINNVPRFAYNLYVLLPCLFIINRFSTRMLETEVFVSRSWCLFNRSFKRHISVRTFWFCVLPLAVIVLSAFRHRKCTHCQAKWRVLVKFALLMNYLLSHFEPELVYHELIWFDYFYTEIFILLQSSFSWRDLGCSWFLCIHGYAFCIHELL